jgi:signal peptidase I
LLNKDDETNKHRHTRLSKEVLVIVVIGVCIIVIWLGLKFVLHVDNPFYVVSSESMVPTLMVGDLVVLRNGAGGFSFSDLHVGDIIVFHTEDGGGRTIVHKIVEIYADTTNSERLVKTKGDNNPISYEDFDYPIREQDYYGKVIYIVPMVGLIAIPPFSYVISAVAISLVSATLLIGTLLFKKRINKEEKEEEGNNKR